MREVFAASGGIAVGAFSEDFAKLALGDATGKVHLLASANEIPQAPNSSGSQHFFSNAVRGLQSLHRSLRTGSVALKSKTILHHPEPPPPLGTGDVEQARLAQAIARNYLEEGQLSFIGQPGLGVVQGPNYAETRLYCKDAHEDGDIAKPLLPEWQVMQQFERLNRRAKLSLPYLSEIRVSDLTIHDKNTGLDLDLESLLPSTSKFPREGQIDLEFDIDESFDFELAAGPSIFKTRSFSSWRA